MSEASEPEQKLTILSLPPKVVVINKIEQKVDSTKPVEEEVILAPILEEKAVEKLSNLIDKVYDEFSQACENRNLNWEAELELGMEFGVKFTAKLKMSPKSQQ